MFFAQWWVLDLVSESLAASFRINRTVTGAGGRGRSHVTCTMHGCGHVRRGNLCVEDATVTRPCSPALVASRSGEDS